LPERRNPVSVALEFIEAWVAMEYELNDSKTEEPMSKVKVGAFSISLDGFGAGPRQNVNDPIGARGHELHSWLFETAVFKKMIGESGGSTGIDNDFAAQSFENVGAWIMGRNMFGPVRGSWQDDSWKGWWGDNPPYHTPVFVLTHYPRPAVTMEGGTTFHFVTDGPVDALARAREAAKGRDVRIGGGVSVIRQYLASSLIDEMHLAVSAVLLGEGEHLFGGLDLPGLGFAPCATTSGEGALHVIIRKR
jgi:dihydrofolate reductase